jgi:hypothetical protein
VTRAIPVELAHELSEARRRVALLEREKEARETCIASELHQYAEMVRVQGVAIDALQVIANDAHERIDDLLARVEALVGRCP